MAKFKVFQEPERITGIIRYGHREGIIEADSREDALKKLENEEIAGDLDFVIDDYDINYIDYGDNEFEIEEVEG